MPIRISGSTGISGLDGSATTPVLQGASANSGIYYSGNTVFVATSGTTALTIGPTGNVALTNNNFSIAGQYISPYSGMMKNRIINGDFRIDQRFAGAANNNIVGSQYVVDRWRSNGSSAAKLRLQQNNTNGPGSSATQTATGFPYYFGANVVSSNTVNSTDYWFFAQDIEGLNTADLGWGTANASPVTLSFWSYSSIAGTHGGSIRNYDANRAYPFSYSISAANTWQYQTITVPGDTTGNWFSNNNIGLTVFFGMGLGSNYTSTANGTWQIGNILSASGSVSPVSSSNGSFYLTGVQLEKGSQATAFEFRHYTTELQLCQRYYENSFSYDQSAVGNNKNAPPCIMSMYLSSDGQTQPIYFKVSKRVAPTLTQYSSNNVGSPTAGQWQYYVSGSGWINPPGGATTSLAQRGYDAFNATLSGVSLTAGYSYLMAGNWTASAELNVQN